MIKLSSHVKISMISLISSLSLKLYLNSLVYHQNIFRFSSKVFGNLWTSSEIFRNSWKMFGNIHLAFGTFLENFRKSLENHQKRRHQYAYIIKRTLHVSSKIWILCSRGKNAHSWDTVLAWDTVHIFSSPCNILYLQFDKMMKNKWNLPAFKKWK